MNRLSISIVTYRTDHQLLRRCLAAIASSSVQADVIVVDNSPTDESRDLAGQYSAAYIHLPHNPGFGAGHNVALEMSLARSVRYHLVLNPDVDFTSGVLEELLDYMDANPRVAQVMPKVTSGDGSLQRLCKLVPTPVDLILRRFVPGSWFTKLRQRFELWESGYDKIMFAPCLSGCFMMLRCDALREVGVFDERFFMYAEDFDLGRRLAAKFETHFYPHVSIIHEHGAASYRSLRMLYVHVASVVKYFNKWGWLFDTGRSKLNRKTHALISGHAERSAEYEYVSK